MDIFEEARRLQIIEEESHDDIQSHYSKQPQIAKEDLDSIDYSKKGSSSVKTSPNAMKSEDTISKKKDALIPPTVVKHEIKKQSTPQDYSRYDLNNSQVSHQNKR